MASGCSPCSARAHWCRCLRKAKAYRTRTHVCTYFSSSTLCLTDMFTSDPRGDDLDLLVSSWETHLVTPPPANQGRVASLKDEARKTAVNQLYPLRGALGSCAVALQSVRDATYFSRVCSAEPLLSTSASGKVASAYAPSEEGGSADALWLLSLVCHNEALMKVTTQLTVQFQDQYAALCRRHRDRVDALRAQHQLQLATLLDAPSSTTNMIVDSSVTERFVTRHAEALRALRRECRAEARALEVSQQGDLRAFLQTSAPDAIARLERASSRATKRATPYRPEVDVSRFAEQDNTRASRVPSPSTTAKLQAVHEATGRQRPQTLGRPPVAPVRTICLPNPLARDHRSNVSAAAAPTKSSGTSPRQPRVATPPIVLDVSPSSWLPRCLSSCAARSPIEANTQSARGDPPPPLSTTTAAIGEHLMRLSHTRTSMLLLLATEAAARAVLTTVPSPELFLTDAASSGALHSAADGEDDPEDSAPLFTPLPHHPNLKMLFTTRLWGANVVLLYTPPSFLSHDEGDAEGCDRAASRQDVAPKRSTTAFDTTIPPVVEDALQLAYSWNVDMFSVAVLDSKPTVRHDFSRRHGAAQALGWESRASDRSPAHGVSAQVLSQLQRGLADMIFQTSQFKTSYLWSIQEEELLASNTMSLDASRVCPRTVGTRYSGTGGVDTTHATTAVPTGIAKLGEFSTTTGQSPTSPLPRSTTRAPVTLLQTAATFNTPMAVRVFLPIPESFFAPPAEEAVDARAETHVTTPGARTARHKRADGSAAVAGQTPSSSLAGSTPVAGRAPEPHSQGGGPSKPLEIHTSFASDDRRSGDSQMRYHASTLAPNVDPNDLLHGDREVRPTDDAGLKAFLYYACGEGAAVV